MKGSKLMGLFKTYSQKEVKRIKPIVDKINGFEETISKLKKLGKKYGLNPNVIYPHSFRHRFAKSFLDRFNDISLLADLMGHESIETTRIYLRRTSTEQQEIVNKIIDW